MSTYSLSDSNKESENNTIKHILHNNNYDVSILKKLSKTEQKVQKEESNTKKSAKFTYIVKETKFIIKQTIHRFLNQSYLQHKQHHW
jgi:hypothetical protein